MTDVTEAAVAALEEDETLAETEEPTEAPAEDENDSSDEEESPEAREKREAKEREEAEKEAERQARIAEEEALAKEGPASKVAGGPVKFVIKKAAFLNALEKAGQTVGSSDNEPLLKTFNIEADTDQVRILSTDLALGSIAKIRVADIKQTGAICVPAKRLVAIIRSAEDGDITFEVQDKQATVTAGRARWQINVLEAEDYPEVPRFDPSSAQEVRREDLLDVIQKVRYAASTDQVRPSLMLIAFFKYTDDDGTERGAAATSDGSRLQWVDFDQLAGIQIPIFAVGNLVRLLQRTEVEKVMVELKPNHLLFQIGADTFSTQRLFEEFPDVRNMILKKAEKNDQELTLDREQLIAAVNRVRIAADEERKQLEIQVTSENQVQLRALDQNGELAVEDLPCATSLEEGRLILVNHQFFSDALEMNPAKQVTLKLAEDTKARRSPLYMREGKLRSVLLQLRPEE